MDSTTSERRGKRRPGRPPRDPNQPTAYRPEQPYKDFPLTAHSGGKWMKKVQGKIHYFGRWAERKGGKLVPLPDHGWKEALEIWLAVKDDLYAGRTPRVRDGALTVGDLCNRFLTVKKQQLESGDIGARMWQEYFHTCHLLVAQFGKNRRVDDLAADDFEALLRTMADRWGPVRRGNEIGKTKSVFKYGFEAGLIDRPIRYGPMFKKPSRRVIRKLQAKNGEQMFEADEIRRMLDAASVQFRAMILLGVNCGFGNTDCATLPLLALDLDAGWINFPRPKTGIPRRCPLWPETVEALRAVIRERPTPKQKEARDLVFVRRNGRSYLVSHMTAVLCSTMRDLMREAGVYREGRGFYGLRHTFRTVADGSRDQVACNSIMGHSDNSMASAYRERIEDDRLLAVTERVREWLGYNENSG